MQKRGVRTQLPKRRRAEIEQMPPCITTDENRALLPLKWSTVAIIALLLYSRTIYCMDSI